MLVARVVFGACALVYVCARKKEHIDILFLQAIFLFYFIYLFFFILFSWMTLNSNIVLYSNQELDGVWIYVEANYVYLVTVLFYAWLHFFRNEFRILQFETGYKLLLFNALMSNTSISAKIKLLYLYSKYKNSINVNITFIVYTPTWESVRSRLEARFTVAFIIAKSILANSRRIVAMRLTGTSAFVNI